MDKHLESEIEDLNTEDSAEDTIESKEHMEKFSAMVRQSLAEEHEAAAEYTKRAAKCEEHGMEDAAKLFRDIAEEEVVHAGEFQALMEKYGILNQDAIDQGEQEGSEILTGEKTEPEIDSEVEMQEESAEDKAFLDKPEIYSRLQQLLDFNVEDHKAVTVLDLIYHFSDVDQFQKFYEFVQEELDMNYMEIFGPKVTEESADSKKFTAKQYNVVQDGSYKDPVTEYKADSLAKLKNIFKDSSELNTVDKIEIFKDGKLIMTGKPEILDGEKRYSVTYTAENEAIDPDEFIQKQIQADQSETVYIVKSLLDGEKDSEPSRYSERNIRNLYMYYLIPNKAQALNMSQEEIDSVYDSAREKVWITPIEEIIDFLNGTGEMEVTVEATEDAAGTMASMGEAPTAVAGQGVSTAEPTEMCEELRKLKEAMNCSEDFDDLGPEDEAYWDDEVASYKVVFTDGTEDADFSFINGLVMYNDSEIGTCEDEEDAAAVIADYCERELEQEVAVIYDEDGEVIY